MIAPKGLEGVVVDSTRVSHVMPEISALVYRGYPVAELAELCSFEELACLLWHGELPTREQLERFSRRERSHRQISSTLLKVIELCPKQAHPMDVLRTGVSFLGMEDANIWGNDFKSNEEKAFKLLARIPLIIAAAYRLSKGREFIQPNPELPISENFFQMCFGEVPAPEIVRAFDVSMVLYAEHSFNASTFTARVVTSSLSDMYSAVTAAIGSLKGPLHGGANEQVMHMLKEIGDPTRAKDWIMNALREKRKIMGFGHRVYKKWDSRAPTMKKYGMKLAGISGETKWHDISEVLERTMIETKNIYPNLDFPAGPAYYLMGFDIEMFTSLFVMSRITGWAAHIFEQNENNRLIRPLSEYVGPKERTVVPLAQRG